MNELGFNIRTSLDFFKKLLEDYNDFCNDKTSSRFAMNCSLTAWHLSEWIYNEFNNLLSNQFTDLSAFQQDLKNQCSSLQIMHDIANGTKHFKLTKHNPIINDTKLYIGGFSRDFSRDFDVSSLNIILKDGNKIYFEDEIEIAIEFWRTYLTTNFHVEL